MPFQQPWMRVKRATCRNAAVFWRQPGFRNVCPPYWLITLSKVSEITEMAKMCFFYVKGQMTQLHLPLLLTAGSEYRVSVAAISHAFIDTNLPSFLVFDEGVVNFRAGSCNYLVGSKLHDFDTLVTIHSYFVLVISKCINWLQQTDYRLRKFF